MAETTVCKGKINNSDVFREGCFNNPCLFSNVERIIRRQPKHTVLRLVFKLTKYYLVLKLLIRKDNKK